MTIMTQSREAVQFSCRMGSQSDIVLYYSLIGKYIKKQNVFLHN